MQGKTLVDARGDLFRGIEVVELACSAGHFMMGETLGGLSKGLDTYSCKEMRCGSVHREIDWSTLLVWFRMYNTNFPLLPKSLI